MANQILAGAVFQAGQVIAGVDADTILDTFIAPSTTSSTVANKIFMWNRDARNGQTGAAYSNVGGVVMTDGDFSNPTTIQLDSSQMVVGGEGKVVTIAQLGEIKVYDESTGQLEQTFNDSYLDSTKANSIWNSANDAVIGAGKIFISSPEHNPNGIGSIIVVDLLDRNVATYLITPTLGNYSRLSHADWGGIKFIDGRIYGHTSQWSSDDQGIWHFAPDGSDEQFIPTPGATGGSGVVKWGDNFVVRKENAFEVIDSSGAILNSVSKTYPSQTYAFAEDFAVTSTGKLVVSNKIHYNPLEYSIFLYDEGVTNEIEFKPADIPNGIASNWGYGTKANSGGFEVFGEYILVSAKEADNNGITNCGAVYRYNDSGVLQDIFYGTVANQRIGTNISVGAVTTTTTLPTFIAPPYERPDVLDEDSGWVTVSTFSSHDGSPEHEYISPYVEMGQMSYNKSDYNGITTVSGGREDPSTYYEFNPTKVATKQITGLVVGETYTIDVEGQFFQSSSEVGSMYYSSQPRRYSKMVVGVTTDDTTGLWRWRDISPLLEAYHITEVPNPSGGMNPTGNPMQSTSPVEFVATSSTYTVVLSKNTPHQFPIEKMEIKRV